MKPKILLIAFALIFLAACAAKWETLSEGGFTVQMPGTPNKQSQSINTAVGPVTINMYTVETKGEAFIVAYSDYPEAAASQADPQQLLNNARDGAVRNVNGKITSERSVTLNGKPGKEIIGDGSLASQEGTFVARIYWVSPRIYQALYVRPKGSAASENGNKFLDSFQLTGK